jgi:hypothetical protein
MKTHLRVPPENWLCETETEGDIDTTNVFEVTCAECQKLIQNIVWHVIEDEYHSPDTLENLGVDVL